MSGSRLTSPAALDTAAQSARKPPPPAQREHEDSPRDGTDSNSSSSSGSRPREQVGGIHSGSVGLTRSVGPIEGQQGDGHAPPQPGRDAAHGTRHRPPSIHTTPSSPPPTLRSTPMSSPAVVARGQTPKTAPPPPSYFLKRSGLLPTYKVLLIGDAAVGKTNLLGRYCRNEFDTTAPATIGIEFASRELEVPTGSVGEVQQVVVQLWDTAGQERCSTISNVYYRNAVGAVLVYDVTRRETFLNIPGWAAQVRALANADCICVVVANKADLPEEQWAVTVAEGEELAHTLGMRHFATSACTGTGVMHAFTQMILAVNAVQSVRLEAALGPTVAPVAAGGAGRGYEGHPRASPGVSPHAREPSGSPLRGTGAAAQSPHARSESMGSPITRSLHNAYFSTEERSLWTMPSTVPHGFLSTSTSTTGLAGEVGRTAGGSLEASQTSTLAQPFTRRAYVHGGGGEGGKRTLDLRGFGGGGEAGEPADGLGGGCGC